MERPSFLKHIRDILILPFTVSVVVPYFLYIPEQKPIPDHIFIKLAGVVICLIGLGFFFYTLFLFITMGKGTLAPWTPTQKLIIKGPYQYCRNPMITAVLFILIGEALFFHSFPILIWACTFFIINTIYFIVKEEPDLEKRFGKGYHLYKKNVPRWMPKRKPYKP